MRRRGIDHAHIGVVDQGNGFARRIVRQAQNHQIRGVQRGLAGRRILALRVAELKEFQIGTAGQPLANLKPGRARRAIYEDFRHHNPSLVLRQSAANIDSA